MTRSEVLAAQLPALPLQSRLRPADRVVFVGENDRFHCPAALVWRAEFLPVAAWGSDPAAWRRGFSELGIDAVLLRSDRERLPGGLVSIPGLLRPDGDHGEAVLYRVNLLK